ncbi:hypothetical protein Vretimale_19033 [Volvox reticuliferus]|uniref:Ubiquitin-like-conjugating enzyme ATG10 n=2 Tax=Volvox reticuliferus TaxID=1737510 RepID=A0A8J4GYI1_9CHLO|nr:hypothetical protein Vretimale_19033 [Volvox reticuliferus]
MLSSSNWRQTLQLFQSADNLHPWQLRETQMGPYLALEGVPRLPERQAHIDHIGTAVQPVLLDYHVCYSHSYQVPIMCFRVTSIDGQPLALVGLRETVFPFWPSESEQMQWFVMQQEHPLLAGPCWFSLHPCHTATVLALALGLDADTVRHADMSADGAGVDGAATTAADDSGGGGGTANSVVADAGACGRADAIPGAHAALHGLHHREDTSGNRLVVKNDLEFVSTAANPVPVVAVPGQPHQAASRGGSTIEDVPDLDQLLASGGAYSSAEGGPGNPGSGDAAAAGMVERMAGGLGAVQTTMGEEVAGATGVRWPGGDVPLCASDSRSLKRYICAWFSLVGPQVGLEVSKDLMQ